MFQFQDVTCKLGNMKKPQQFTICPNGDGEASNEVMIQSEKRIARINLDTGKGILSDGKGGHPGFHKLMKMLGAVEIDVPPEVIAEIKSKLPNGKPVTGPVVILG